MDFAPSDTQIADFVSFTGAQQQDAVNYLTREPNFEKAVQNYYDSQERGTTGLPPEYPATWNENEMHAGKEYGPEPNPGNRYQIHSVENTQTLRPDIFTTLSRPPSRIDDKLDDKEDTDLQQGLINSMSSSRHDANTVSFGPATGEYYPANQWSLTTTTQKVLPDPEPMQRARMLGSPAFIKPNTAEDRVPGLLTIFQHIPYAREALLLRDHVRPEYGSLKDWWQGDSIRSRGIITSTDQSQSQEQSTPTIDEVQRLMAFLELTERAYCSSEPLKEALSSSRFHPWTDDHDIDAHLLSVWREEYKEIADDLGLMDVFTTIAVERTNGIITEQSPFQIFKLSVQYATDIGSLYDLIDEVLWGLWVIDAPTEVFFKPADVLTFQMIQNSATNGIIFDSIDWPLSFYADRYLEENKDKALEMLYAQASTEEERNNIQVQQNKLEHVMPSSNSKNIAATELLKVVKPFLSGERLPIDELDRRDEVVASGAKYHPLDEYQSVGKELQAVADGILRKHEALEQTKGQLNSKKKITTDFLKESSTQTGVVPVHRYTLRGVSTDQNTTYVLVNPNAVDDLMDTDIDSWDWWKIHWDSQKDNPVDLQKVSSKDVTQAACKADNVTAVYASDKAVDYPQKPVPDPLKNFVRADNLHFAIELENPEYSFAQKPENPGWSYVRDQAYNYQSRSRNSSIDSMQANLDTEMNDSLDLGGEDTYPPSYSTTPPPIPPRIGEKRKASERLMVENLIDAEMDSQESGTINLMDDEMDTNPPVFSNMGNIPGGPQTEISGSVGESMTYASEIQMSDVVELRAPTPGLRFLHPTIDPSKITVKEHAEQPSLI